MLFSRALALCFFGAFVFSACAKAEESSHLYAQDLDPPENAPDFDADNIIALEELTDSSVRADTLRAFLTNAKSHKNPYGRESFLSTYYSNGLSAIDALINAAEQYHINPIVLLARAEMEQGLVGLEFYPVDDPSRVENVFRCGCSGPSSCDPAYAGFDHQVDCLARQYRIILNDMDANGGVTSGGWAKGREGRTLDAKTVTPADDGTAVAYQFDPRVGDRKSGNRLFWTIWQNYVKASGYQPNDVVNTGAWIGDPCVRDEQCKAIGADAVCVISYPGGMCTVPCRDGCPPRDGRESACVSTGQGAYCFQRCSQSASSSCRSGSAEWACCSASVYPPVSGVTQPVCRSVQPGQGCQ
jgi:hypothetical protein